MTDAIKFLDPVKGLIEYVEDIKPYHTKIIESLVEYVSQEFVETTITEDYLLHIGLDYGYSIPLNQLLIVPGNTTVLNTKIPTRSNLRFIGSPPTRLYNFDETLVFVNGVLQKESISMALPNGSINDYSITGNNQITFVVPLELNDIVVIYTYTQHRHVPNECDIGGFGSSNYDMRNVLPVVSPDPFILMIDYPGLLLNTFIVMGDRLNLFDATKNTSFHIESFIEDVINNTKTPQASNTRDFTIADSELIPASGTTLEHTIVTISGSNFVPFPIGIQPNERYVSIISLNVLTYDAVIPYSNIIPAYDFSGSPIQTTQTPDEGVLLSPVVDLGVGVSGYVMIDGDLRASNIMIGDTLSIIESTGNNDDYTIHIITYIPADLSGSPTIPERTRFDVSNIISGVIDGNVVLNISANSFVLGNDYTNFFPQGMGVNVTTGSAQGIYTTLNSKFINNKTYIRVIEDIMQSHGSEIISITANSVTITGDFTSLYTSGTNFNLVRSQRNNALYSVTGSSTINNTTTISVTETIDDTDTTGTIFYFEAGILDFVTQGFGQTSQFCADLHANIVNVGIDDNLHLDTLDSTGSPSIDLPMYQFAILGTTANTITVSGDATVYGNITSTNIIHSNYSPNNDGTYTVTLIAYDISTDKSVITVTETIPIVSATTPDIIPGGWIEGYI